MDESEYKKRYKSRLIKYWRFNEHDAQEIAYAAEFDPSDPEPEDHADDCVFYMAQDA
jgi:hypothetical protein